jgi:hypothetical protein
MIETVSAPVQPPRGLIGRVVGSLVSPQSTYAEMMERPTWAGLMAVVMVLMAVPMAVLMSTAVGQRALIDMQLQTIEAFGRTANDAQYQVLQRFASFAPYKACSSSAASSSVSSPDCSAAAPRSGRCSR